MKTLRKHLSVLLCLIMILGTAAIESNGVSKILDTMIVKADAEETVYKQGDIIEFGSYPQTKVSSAVLKAELATKTMNELNTIEYDGNKYLKYKSDNITNFYLYEPIQWKVLSVGNDGIFILSDKILDQYVFFESIEPSSNTWEKSDLRSWLNSDFYEFAFSTCEKELIINSYLINDGEYSGNDTIDKIFVPSTYDMIDEYDLNLAENQKALVTDYAKSKDLTMDDNNQYAFWWLRTTHSISHAYICSYNGGVTHTSITNSGTGVRPALKLNLNSTETKVENISLNKDNLELKISESEILSATFYPENATNKDVTWSSNNEDVVVVTQKGKVIAVGTGEATITVKTVDGGFCDNCTVTVSDLPHTHNYKTTVTKPSCTEKGYITYTCSCDDSYKSDYIDALGHSFTNYIYNNDATTEHDGTETAKCDRCEMTDTRTKAGTKIILVDVDPQAGKKVSITNYKQSLDVDYKSTVIMHANVPEGYTAKWSNGQSGSECKLDTVTNKNYVITCHLEKGGKEIDGTESSPVIVNVDTGFFAKIVAFFRGLFKTLPTYIDFKKA